MKNTFLLKYFLSMFLCGAVPLVGMDETSPPKGAALKQNPTAVSHESVLTFTTLKRQHEEDKAQLMRNHKIAIDEYIKSAQEARQRENQLNTLNHSLSEQNKVMGSQWVTISEENTILRQEKETLFSQKQQYENSIKTAQKEHAIQINSMNQSQQELKQKMAAEIKQIVAQLRTKNDEHTKTLEELTKVQAEYGTVLFYKNLFFTAFLACAVALVGHLLYIHYGFTELPLTVST